MRERFSVSMVSVVIAGAAATFALGQTETLAAAQADKAAQSAASIPDFSGIWAHPALGFGPPLSGPGPVRNKSRLPSGAGKFDELVGDYTNPILKPEAAAVVKKRGEISLSGRAFPDPDNQCLQNPVPYIFWNFDIQLLQQKDKVTIIYQHDDDFREVRLNQPHPAKVVPSVHGDSVGHYEGDTLVVDTVGIRLRPYTMVDRFGTPYTQALHVVERYRLLDYDAAKEGRKNAPKKSGRASGTMSIATTGARACSSNSPWRIRASSPCRGRRPRRICAPRAPRGRNVSAPKMSGTIMRRSITPTRTLTYRPPTSRISERHGAGCGHRAPFKPTGKRYRIPQLLLAETMKGRGA